MKEKKHKRRNTKLESEGAEFLVLGNLLLNGIPSYKAYINMPGYDLIATNPEKNTSVKIQVKSRYQTNWDGFIIKNFESDFVVLVALNRGKPQNNYAPENIQLPEFYVMPIDFIKKIRDKDNKWGKITKSRMNGFKEYLDKWDLIKEELLKERL
jgi:hypothetical protein